MRDVRGIADDRVEYPSAERGWIQRKEVRFSKAQTIMGVRQSFPKVGKSSFCYVAPENVLFRLLTTQSG